MMDAIIATNEIGPEHRVNLFDFTSGSVQLCSSTYVKGSHLP